MRASKVGFPVTPLCMLRNEVNAVSLLLFFKVLKVKRRKKIHFSKDSSLNRLDFLLPLSMSETSSKLSITQVFELQSMNTVDALLFRSSRGFGFSSNTGAYRIIERRL